MGAILKSNDPCFEESDFTMDLIILALIIIGIEIPPTVG
jgi:hypothetical protein